MKTTQELAAGNVVEVPEDVADLVPAFLERAKESARQIFDLMRADSIDEVTRIGHNLAGSGTSYGFPEVSRLGRQIEMASRNGEIGSLEEFARQLVQYLGCVEWRPES